MTADTTVTATFIVNPLIKLPGGIYAGTLEDAYAQVSDGATLELTVNTFNENMVFDRDISISLKGGMNADFTEEIGSTTVSGSMSFENGTVDIKGMIVE